MPEGWELKFKAGRTLKSSPLFYAKYVIRLFFNADDVIASGAGWWTPRPAAIVHDVGSFVVVIASAGTANPLTGRAIIMPRLRRANND